MPIKDDNQNPLEILAGMSGGSGRKHPVPQNVMDVEFKVVGDLTLRQLGYLCLGGAGAYIFWNSGLPYFWAVVLAVFSIVLGIAVAFVPIEERGLDKWVVLFLRAMTFQTQLIWKKSSITPAYFLSDYADIIKNEIITLTPVKSRSKLDEYLGLLPEDPDEMDLYQTTKVSNISSKFESQMTVPTKLATDIKLAQKTPSFNSFNAPEKRIQISKPKPAPKPIEQPQIPTFPQVKDTQPATPVSVPITAPVATSSKTITAPTPKEPQTKPTEPQIPTVPPIISVSIAPEPAKTASIPVPSVAVAPALVAPINIEVNKDELETKLELLNAFEGTDESDTMEIISATKVDRPIKSWPKKYESELKGEIKIKTTAKLPPTIVAQDIKEIKQQETSLEKKIEELMNVASKAKEELEAKGLNLDQNDRIEFYRNKYHELRQEKENLASEIDKNTSRVNQIEEDSKKKDLESQVNMLTHQNEELEEKLKFIQEQLFLLKNKDKGSDNIQTEQQQSATPTQPEPESYLKTGKMPKPTKLNPTDNIIFGTVKNGNGGLSDNTVVLIKDIKGNVVRALKTNKLGQFRIQTALENGTYLVEAVKGGENFDIIKVEATGSQLNPVYLIAKPK